MIKLEEPLVSIILSNFNGLKHLEECFNSLYNLNYSNFEIIFIDNNSKDKSVDFVKKNYSSVKIIQNETDLGFSRANNIAASHARGKYIALLNIDTIVDTNWLIELVKVAEISEKIGIVVSKHYYYYDKELINFAGSSSDKFLKSHHIGLNKRDHKLLNIQLKTFYACFAAALLRRNLYKKIGLFDPYYYAFAEDLDLSWRVWIAGYNVIYAPKSFIYHKTGEILGKKNPRKKFLLERNKLRTLLKNYEIKSIIYILPIYIMKRIGVVIRNALKGEKDTLLFITTHLKSFLWNLYHLKSLLKYRKIIQTYRKRDDKFIFQLMDKTSNWQNTLKDL